MTVTDPQVVREAARWLVELETSSRKPDVLAQIERWCQRSPQHRRAWAAAAELSQGLAALPALPAVGAESLQAARRVQGRRRALRALAVGAVTVPPVLLLGQRAPWQAWAADHRTQPGEQRALTLADGAVLHLNTASSLDLTRGGDGQQLWLRAGEVLVARPALRAGAPDAPLMVHTRDGAVQLRGERASVQLLAHGTRVAALAGEVQLLSSRGAPLRGLRGGQAAVFDASDQLQMAPVSLNDEVWLQGLIHADRMPLPEFLALVSRYHRGLLRCDPQLQTQRISGLYRHADLSGILQFIAANYPVRLRFLTPLWTSVERA